MIMAAMNRAPTSHLRLVASGSSVVLDSRGSSNGGLFSPSLAALHLLTTLRVLINLRVLTTLHVLITLRILSTLDVLITLRILILRHLFVEVHQLARHDPHPAQARSFLHQSEPVQLAHHAPVATDDLQAGDVLAGDTAEQDIPALTITRLEGEESGRLAVVDDFVRAMGR